MSENLSDFENSQVGLALGVLEITLLQPLNFLKNARQQALPLTVNPRVLYRGFAAAVANMGTCTMFQVTVMGRYARTMIGDSKRQLTNQEQLAGGFLAGATSAVVGGPIELVMIQQQRTGRSLFATTMGLMNPNITRGIVPTACREGLWAMGFLAVPPVIRGTLRSNFPDTFNSEDKARVPSAFLGAFLVCYLSHPFDTAKTCMQGDIERKKFGSLRSTFATLYAESGFRGFYRGVPWRFLRQSIAIFCLDKARDVFTDFLFPHANAGRSAAAAAAAAAAATAE